jgi:hypothetical protein
MTIQDSIFSGAGTLTQAAGAAAGTLLVNDSRVVFTNITQNGSGVINIYRTDAITSTISNSAAALRSLQIQDSELRSATVSQQRTLNANFDIIVNSSIKGGSTVNSLGAAGGAANTNLVNASLIDQGSVVNFTDAGSGNNLTFSEVVENSTLNVQAGAAYNRGRVGAFATVNTGSFVHDSTIIELNGTHTLTAANSNRLRNKSFSDII